MKSTGVWLSMGVSSIDLSTGTSFVEERAYRHCSELVNKIVQLKHSAMTVAVFSKGDLTHEIYTKIRDVGCAVKGIDQVMNQTYIEDSLRRVFGGSNVPLQQKLNINLLPHASIALVLNLDCIYKMNPRILSNIAHPQLQVDDGVLFNASLLQDIHILPPQKNSIQRAELIFDVDSEQTRTTCMS
jgi:DNA mismatch repair ATPase MutS